MPPACLVVFFWEPPLQDITVTRRRLSITRCLLRGLLMTSGLFDAAKTLRRQAAAYVLRAANSPDLRLRLLDVLRRSSEWDEAASLATEMMAEPLEHPLSSIVRFQSDKIKSRDDNGYSVAEALSAAATEDGPDDAMLERVASFIQILPPKRRGS